MHVCTYFTYIQNMDSENVFIAFLTYTMVLCVCDFFSLCYYYYYLHIYFLNPKLKYESAKKRKKL